MSFLKIEDRSQRVLVRRFPVGLDRRLKKDPLVDTLCENVVVGDSNERISTLSRNGEIPVARGTGDAEGASRGDRRSATYCALRGTRWKDLGRI